MEEEPVALEAEIHHHATEYISLQESHKKPHTNHHTTQEEFKVLNAKVKVMDKQPAYP
ncbi:hypothetical protein BDF14DRAFT_1826031 [Spinellus fusiger]|nr:hypothetical protein BDF14DRAFT_1826007 [Spinellus fusiger]KAI7865348.1 hypothetical protein BDF14DRAFT_1826031 [Spinellus fusiger]